MKNVIYKITNLINGKIYFGLTGEGFNKRKSKHLSSLRNGKHRNKHLQAAFIKYGELNFKFEPLVYTKTYKELKHIEIAYIKKHKTYNPTYGYNKTLGGESGKFTKEIILKKRKLACNKKSVVQYDLNGNKIKCFESVQEAYRDSKVERSEIKRSCNQNGYRARKWMFRWASENLEKIPPHDPCQRHKKKMKKVIQLDLNKKLVKKWDSMVEAAKVLNCCVTAISRSCRFNVKAYGFYWTYA